MHGGKVIVSCQGANQWIVASHFAIQGFTEAAKRKRAFFAAGDATVLGRTKCDVFVSTAHTPWRAMVVIGSSDDQPMNFENKIGVPGIIFGKVSYPSVSLNRSSSLTLRPGVEFFCTLVHGSIKLVFGEICTLNACGTCHLTFQLNPLELFGPASLIRDGREGHDSSFCRCQWRRYRY